MSLRTVTDIAAPHRSQLALAAFFMLAETAAALTLPWLGGLFAAGVFAGRNVAHEKLVLLLLAVFAVQAALKFCSAFFSGRVAERIASGLRLRLYEHLQALPLAYFNARRRGDILALLTNDAARIAHYVTGTLLNVVPMAIMLAGALLLMSRIDIRLTLAVALSLPAFYLALKIIGRRIRPLAIDIQNEDARLVALAEENLAVLPVIKAFTREPAELCRFQQQSTRLLALNLEQKRIFAALEPAIQFFAATAAVLVLWLATSRDAATSLAPNELVSFLLYAALLTRPVANLASVYGQTQGARGAFARIEDALGETREPLYAAPATVKKVRGAIDFEDVTFAYPGRPAALDGATMTIVAGETVAITGANGAGKSTLAHLLMRLYAPQSGRILIDGADIAAMGLSDLRRNIGLVSQRVLLFNASVRDNIALGKDGADQAAIEAAACQAEAHEFISRLPLGYDTVIGDSGVRLSGGQRQRIALARALIKAPPILILDEATAMFDPVGECDFIARSQSALQDRTVILITHRPASLALASRILKLEDGRFVED